MAYLYIFEKYPELDISQINNLLEAIISHLKINTKIRKWLTEKIKYKIIEYCLYIS